MTTKKTFNKLKKLDAELTEFMAACAALGLDPHQTLTAIMISFFTNLNTNGRERQEMTVSAVNVALNALSDIAPKGMR